MDKLEKIRQEIERRRLHFNKEAEKYQALNNGYSQNCYGARDALRDLENFINTLSEEPSESLEEAAEEYASDYPACNDEQAIAKYAFKRGAEWQKKQMLKEAVNGIARIGYPFLSSNPFVDIQESKDSWCKLMRKFMDGDKVRILVLKEKEE